MRGADLGTVGTEEAAGAPERRRMIAMTFTKLRGLRTNCWLNRDHDASLAEFGGDVNLPVSMTQSVVYGRALAFVTH